MSGCPRTSASAFLAMSGRSRAGVVARRATGNQGTDCCLVRTFSTGSSAPSARRRGLRAATLARRSLRHAPTSRRGASARRPRRPEGSPTHVNPTPTLPTLPGPRRPAPSRWPRPRQPGPAVELAGPGPDRSPETAGEKGGVGDEAFATPQRCGRCHSSTVETTCATSGAAPKCHQLVPYPSVPPWCPRACGSRHEQPLPARRSLHSARLHEWQHPHV
jgi:hypothetical protein